VTTASGAVTAGDQARASTYCGGGWSGHHDDPSARTVRTVGSAITAMAVPSWMGRQSVSRAMVDSNMLTSNPPNSLQCG